MNDVLQRLRDAIGPRPNERRQIRSQTSVTVQIADLVALLGAYDVLIATAATPTAGEAESVPVRIATTISGKLAPAPFDVSEVPEQFWLAVLKHLGDEDWTKNELLGRVDIKIYPQGFAFRLDGVEILEVYPPKIDPAGGRVVPMRYRQPGFDVPTLTKKGAK